MRRLAAALGLFAVIACDQSPGRATAAAAALLPPASALAPEPTVHHLEAAGQLGPGQGTLIVDLQAPKNGKLTEGGPLVVKASGRDLTFPKRLRTRLNSTELPVRLPVDVADGALGPAEVDVYYYWCEQGDTGSCQPERAKLYVELDLSGSVPGGEAHFTHRPRPL